MKIGERVTNVVEAKRALTVFLSLIDKDREAILEMKPDDLNDKESKTKLNIKLDKLFKIDTNLVAFTAYEKSKKNT